MRKAAWILAVALLFVTGFLGLLNSAREWDDPVTALQRSVTLGVLLYGVLGLAAGFGVVRRRQWSISVATAWAVVVTYVATVASFAYSDPSFSQSGTLAGTVAAGVSTALIGAFVIWAARSATRQQNLPPTVGSDHIPSP